MSEDAMRDSVEKLKKENARLKADNEKLRYKCDAIKDMNTEISEHLDNYMLLYNNLSNSRWWKMTKPFRFLEDKLKQLIRRIPLLRKICKGLKMLFTKGPKATFKHIKSIIHIGAVHNYHKISNARRREEEAAQFDRDIKFSVLVPLYNTPIKYLKDMIDSVVSQTYKNWELCLADGSDDAHAEVGSFISKKYSNDKRILYKKLEKNGGISENTNACLDMATGNFISLFDHDDILHPSALYETAKAICGHDADFIYTDEAVFAGNDLANIISFHYKSDFAPDNLKANNYICHFSSFSKALLDKAGRFRHEYDGSQDHDMILRLTEQAHKVFHIRKLLYFWRSHKASVASDINSKPYASAAGRRAVYDSIVRTGKKECTVKSSEAFPAIYNVEYQLQGEPMVSVIVTGSNSIDKLNRCINSVNIKSSYRNYEIIIAENGSNSKKKSDFYQKLNKQGNITFLDYSGRNYSDICNHAAKQAKGEYLLFLHEDVSVITENWIQQMLMYAQRDDVGAVGAKLCFRDGTIQHAGITLAIGADGIADHENYRIDANNIGYMGRLVYARDVSAVTGDCLMIRKTVFDAAGGFDTEFTKAYYDIDLCLKLREEGYLNVINSLVLLYNDRISLNELKNKGAADKIILSEAGKFKKKWENVLREGDPYYNPHFSTEFTDYRLK